MVKARPFQKGFIFMCTFFVIQLLAIPSLADVKDVKVVASIYNPFVFYEKDKLSGFDIDLLDMICRTNNLKCSIEIVSFQEVLNALKEGRADIGMGAIYVTDERKKFINFTSPYLKTGLVYVFRSDAEFTDDLSGKKVGVKKLATGEMKARELSKGFKGLQIFSFNSTEESLDALIEGKVDIVLNDYVNTTMLMHEKYLGKIKIKEGFLKLPELLTHDSIAIAVNKNRPELRNIFEKTLKEIKGSGIMDRMLEKWPQIHSISDYRRFIFYSLFGLISLILLSAVISRYLRQRQLYKITKANEERFRSVLENAPNPAIIASASGKILFLNRRFRELTGYETEDVNTVERLNSYIIEDKLDLKELIRAHKAISEARDSRIRCSDGKVRLWNIQCSPIGRWDNEVAYIIVARDVTEHRELEKQLLQAQKMEVIGRFTGGIAHDFNNYLTAIIGFSQLVSMKLKDNPELRQHIDTVIESAEKAAGLTRQLLAFSRRQVMRPEVINLNEIILDVSKLIKRIIGEDIELKLDLYPSLWNVKADPGQIEQVIMNLVSNARDAMPDGGILTIRTSNTFLDDEYARTHISVTPGEYVMLSVEDTGTGMTEDVKAHIFEPFFTTKELGKGTGLGLATVYGIVKQSGGNIWVYSEPGSGSIFKIYLPKTEEQAVKKTVSSFHPESIRSGKEEILIVEDNKEVKSFIKNVLKELGYTLYEAEDGIKALEILKERKGKVDLIITDLIMPNMRGDRLAEEVRRLYPGIKILFMSGYAENIITEKGIVKEGIKFLEKPLTAQQLSLRVREALSS